MYVRDTGRWKYINTAADETRCRPNGTWHYWPAVACCSLVSYLAYAPSWSVTDDDDRRQRASLVWPPTLCVGGPVTSMSVCSLLFSRNVRWPSRICCQLVSNGEYAGTDRQTDGRTDARPLHYAFRFGRGH